MVSKIINEDIKKIGGPYHFFFLFSESVNYSDAFKIGCSNKKEALIAIPDDLFRYFKDFFCWIPTFFKIKNSIVYATGFDYEGWSMIDESGKNASIQILESLKKIFECAPPDIKLTGKFEEEKQDYIKISIKKESILYILKGLIEMIKQIENGEYILHLGV